MKKVIYMDHAATTKMARQVSEAMEVFKERIYGNPSSVHMQGTASRERVQLAREDIMKTLGATQGNVFFTSGGTESDNWVIRALGENDGKPSYRNMITSKIEHHAILNTMHYMEEQGCRVRYLDVDDKGIVSTKQLEEMIDRNTILVSVMMANNEIGSIQPVKELSEIAHRAGAFFHTDAVQAYGQLDIDVDELGIDFLSASGHKIYGPKGIGFLYARYPDVLKPLLYGGGQEMGHRAGTENVMGIVGLATACNRLHRPEHRKVRKREEWLRDYMMEQIFDRIPYVRLNGHPTMRLPGNVNICFRFVEAGSLVQALDLRGICCSSGSACSSHDAGPSHVLLACGLPEELAYGSVRFSLGEETTKQEVDYAVSVLEQEVYKLRKMSPDYEKRIGKKTGLRPT